jgi:hypothetical protein
VAGSTLTLSQDVTVYAVWQQNPPNIVTLTYVANGATSGSAPAVATLEAGSSASISENSGNLAKADSKFLGWSTNPQATRAAYKGGESLTVAEDVVLYAVWEPVTDTEVVPEPEEPEASDPDQAKAKMVAAAKSEGIPLLPGNVPLYGPAGIATWALVDLVIALAGILFAVVSIVRGIRRKNEEEDGYRGVDEGCRGSGANKGEARMVRVSWFISSIVLAALSVLIFIITQDVSLPMVLVDVWTIVLAVVFAAELVTAKIAFPKKEKEDGGRKRKKYEEGL